MRLSDHGNLKVCLTFLLTLDWQFQTMCPKPAFCLKEATCVIKEASG